MNVAMIIGLLAGLALLIGAVVAVLRRRAVGHGSGGPVLSPGATCLFCKQPLSETDRVAALKERSVRQLLGKVPTELPAGTDPLGNRRWLGHVECASAAGIDLSTAAPVGDASPPPGPAKAGELTCPSCTHRFTPPDIMFVTKADVKRYGRDPVQCPQCDHIWNACRKTDRIKG